MNCLLQLLQVHLKTTGDRRKPETTAGDNVGRALSRHHRQNTCRLADATGKMYFTDVS